MYLHLKENYQFYNLFKFRQEKDRLQKKSYLFRIPKLSGIQIHTWAL